MPSVVLQLGLGWVVQHTDSSALPCIYPLPTQLSVGPEVAQSCHCSHQEMGLHGKEHDVTC